MARFLEKRNKEIWAGRTGADDPIETVRENSFSAQAIHPPTKVG
jgi:hypothetical protein